MNIFEKLTDISLRRLYKFILKRAIGSYLNDELLIEQLQVNSRDGLVTVTDLLLDSTLINKKYVEPLNLPIKVTKVCVKKLDAKISYNVLLANGFTVNIYDLEITIQPIPISKQSSPVHHSNSLSEEDNTLKENSPKDTSKIKSNDNEFDGSEFIANWIEVIIASLQIKIHNVTFIIEDVSKDISMKICLNNLTYYNGSISNNSSLFDLNESFLNTSHLGQSFTASAINTVEDHKTLTIDDMKVVLFDNSDNNESMFEIISINNQIKFDIINKNNQTKLNLYFNCFTIDLNIISSLLLMKLVNTFVTCQSTNNSKSTNSLKLNNDDVALTNLISKDPNLGAILWLEEQIRKDRQRNKSNIDNEIEKYVYSNIGNNNTNDDIDYEEIIQIMKNYHKLKLESNSKPLAMDYIVDDISFSQSEDDGDDLFYDTCQDGSLLSTISPYPMKQTSFKKSVRISSSTSNRSKSNFIFSLHLSTFIIRFNDLGYDSVISTETNSLSLNIEDMKIVNTSTENLSTTSINLENVKIFEDFIPILTFYNTVNRNTSIVNCNISASSNNHLNINVNLSPLIISIHIDRFIYWTKVISYIIKQMEINTVDSSTVNTTMTADISMINMLIHSNKSVERKKWDEFTSSLDIANFPDEWLNIPNDLNEHLLNHLEKCQCNGGMRIQMTDIILSYQTNRSTKENNKQYLSLSNLNMYMYLYQPNSKKYLETLYLAALRDPLDKSSRVILSVGVSKNVDSSADSKVNNEDDTEGRALYGDEGSLPIPVVSHDSIIHLYAYRINISTKHREYCALITLSDMFLPPSNPDISNNSTVTSSKSNNSTIGFGLILHSSISTIRLSESSYEYLFSKFDPIKYTSSPKMISMSVIDPLMEVYVINNQTFFSIQATDISIYELTYEQFLTFNDDDNYNKTFINGMGRNVRIGNSKSLIPFLHRTTLHEKSGRWELLEPMDSDTYTNNSANDNNKNFGNFNQESRLEHIFRLQVLLVDKMLLNYEINKIISIHMSFQDVTIRYDPLSIWLFKVVELLTPLTPNQILRNRNMLDKINDESVNSNSKKIDKVKSSVYEVTNVTIRIRKCLIDYCCEPIRSRLLFSIGLLKMSSRIITNNPKYGIKFSMRDISLHISNQLLSNPLIEQSPIDLYGYRCQIYNTTDKDMVKVNEFIDLDTFIDSHKFIQLLTLDYIENNVIFHDDSIVMNHSSGISNGISLKINMGLCSVYACMDSLDLLTDTINTWWSDFKIMIAESEKKPFEISIEQEPVCCIDNQIEDYINNDDVTNDIFSNNITTIFDYDTDIVEPNVDNSNTGNIDVTLTPTIIPPISNKIQLSDEESKPSGWLNNIQRDAFAPQSNLPNITSDISIPHDNISERSSSPEFQAKWLPQYGSEDDVEDDEIASEDQNLNNCQYIDEDDDNNIGQYSNNFNNNNLSYKSIDGIENTSINHHNEAVIDSVLLDDLLHRQSNDNNDYNSNDNIVMNNSNYYSDKNNRTILNSNSYINNNNINYDSSSDNYNPKNSSKFKFIEEDIDDINDYWNDYDITDELNKSDENMNSDTKKSTNLIDLNSNSFYGHKSLTAWSKSINTQSISKINSNNNSYINNNNNNYELYEYNNSSSIINNNNNKNIIKINNYYNNVDESIFDDHVPDVSASNDYSITNDICNTSNNDMLDNMLDLYNQSMSKTLDLSHNNLLPENFSINSSQRKDYERFDSIDGVHNALQITIDDKITIRKAGQVVKESNVYIHDQLDMIFSTSEVINQSNQEIVMDKVSSFDSNDIVIIDEEDYKMIDHPTETLKSNEEDQTGNGTWFQDMKTVKIEDFYIPTTSAFVDPDDDLPDTESKLPVITYLKLNMSIRLKLFSGLDWNNTSTKISHNQFDNKIDNKIDSNLVTTSKSVDDKLAVTKSHAHSNVNFKSSTNNQQTKSKNSLDNNKLFADLLSNSSGNINSNKTKINLYDNKTTQLSTTRTLIDKQRLERKGLNKVPIVNLKTRQEEDMIDISTNNISICLRIYSPIQTLTVPTLSTSILPTQRASLRIQDMLVSFERIGHRKKKVIGWWKSHPKPRIVGMPLLHAVLVGYPTTIVAPVTINIADDPLVNENRTSESLDELQNKRTGLDIDNLEHRVVITLLPLRCYLDPYLIQFIKSLNELQYQINILKIKKETEKKANSNLYFQMITIQSFDVKIDYIPTEINIPALQSGDYLQILNLFPLEELVITLKKIHLIGVLGFSELFEKSIEQWIEDIYHNQIYKVITGTTPLKGLANIGNDIHDLFVVPMKDYQINKQIHKEKHTEAKLLRDIRNKSTKLIKTVARETLHLTHKLSMVVARGIADLASDSPNEPLYKQNNMITHKNLKHNKHSNSLERIGNTNIIRSTTQPVGLKEGLSRAYESVSREMSSAVDSVILLPIREFQRTGSSKVYVKEVVRAIPIAILRPVAGAAEGLSYTLLGLRNLIDPNAKIDEEDVWNVDNNK